MNSFTDLCFSFDPNEVWVSLFHSEISILRQNCLKQVGMLIKFSVQVFITSFLIVKDNFLFARGARTRVRVRNMLC